MVYKTQKQSTISTIWFTIFFQSITGKNNRFAKKLEKNDLEKQKQITILILQKILATTFLGINLKKN